jgi:hypothetical protein
VQQVLRVPLKALHQQRRRQHQQREQQERRPE